MTAKVDFADKEAKGRAELEADYRRLKDENAALRKETEVLRKELIETLNKYSRQSERLRRIEMSAAAAVETLEPVYVGSREDELAESLRQLSEAGGSLAAKTAAFCDDLDAQISGMPLDKVELAKLRLRLDELRTGAQNLAVLSNPPAPPDRFEKCRILELDEKLQVAVLSAGFQDGVRVGLMLKAGPEGSQRVLQVVALRPFVSAARVVKGEFKGLSIGMEAKAGQ